MSIVIKSLKNYKKISKEIKKIFKQQLREKTNSVIGLEWKDDFLKVSNNRKCLTKLDWYNAHVFPLAFYLEKQNYPLDKNLVENFISKINLPPSHYQDMYQLAIKYCSEEKINDLFLFESLGGVDILLFFIDSRGNFVFNDYESKKTFLNKANNGNDLVSIGIKSILNAKKIICFCIDEASKDVVFKLNRKLIDTDDLLTFLHLHNDITLYTLHSIINKNEINNEPMSQEKMQFFDELDKVDDFVDLSELFENTSVELDHNRSINIDAINLENFNKNMENLDAPLEENLESEQEEIDNQVLSNFKQDYVTDISDSLSKQVDDTETNTINSTAGFEQSDGIFENKVDIVEDGYKYLSNFLYIDPKDLDFADSTKFADEKNQKLQSQKLEVFQKTNQKFKQAIYNTDSNKTERLFQSNDCDELSPINSLNKKQSLNLSKKDSFSDGDLINMKKSETSTSESLKRNVISNEEKQVSKLSEANNKLTGNDIPENESDIFNYLKIKNETLQQIEKLLLNNKLGKLESLLIKQHLDENLNHLEKRVMNHEISKFVHNKQHFVRSTDYKSYKFSYISGLRPSPMLMVWYDINKKFYEDLVKTMFTNFSLVFVNNIFDEQSAHIWNDGCYLIYNPDTLIIRALAFTSVDRLIFLLRHVNKNLSMRIANEQTYLVLQKLFTGKESEIKIELI